jgi:hypothetical protein
MKVKANLFSPLRNLDSLAAALAGFLLVQIFSKHSGIGISPDSVTYLSAARHLVAGKGFISFDNFPVVDFPFAYPFLLATISFFTKLDILQFAPALNGLLFAVLLYLCGSVMNGFLRPSGWYKRIILACILLSPAIQEVYSLLWSETIFLLLVLLFIISITHYLNHPNRKWLLITTGVCALACLTRYAGVFLLPAGLGLIFFHIEIPKNRRLKHCLVFGILSALPFLINILRNDLLTGLPMGQRPGNDTSVFEIIVNFGGVFCDWLQIERTPVRSIFFTISVLFVFALNIFFFFRRKKYNWGFEYVAAVSGLMYSLFMIFTSTLTRYEQFTSRLLSPLYIPLIWSLSWWIPGILSQAKSYRFRWIGTAVFLVIAAWFLNNQVAADYEYYDGVKDAGVPGYREDPFLQSGIVQFLEKTKKDFDASLPIYSNAGEAVYLVTDLPARQLPFKAFPEKVKQYYSLKNTYLVWFRDLDNPEMPALDSILKNKNLELIKQVSDGAVYISK